MLQSSVHDGSVSVHKGFTVQSDAADVTCANLQITSDNGDGQVCYYSQHIDHSNIQAGMLQSSVHDGSVSVDEGFTVHHDSSVGCITSTQNFTQKGTSPTNHLCTDR